LARAPKAPLVLAIDVGSTSIRARLYDAAARPIREARASVDHPLPFAADGASEDDADSLADAVERAVDRALERAENAGRSRGDIAAVGMSTYVGNVVGLGRTGRPLTPVYSYADTRSAPDVEALRPVIGTPAHYRRTGAPLHTAYQAPRLAWLKRTQPRRFRSVDRWVDLGTFLYMRWFGAADVPASYSVASWSGMLDRRSRDWDRPTLEAVGIDGNHLPRLADYSEPMQGLARPYARRWRPLAGARFFLAVGDGAAANVGVGCVTADSVALTAGTTGAMRAIVPGAPARVPRGLWAYRLDADHSVVGGAITDAGSLFAWLQATLRLPGQRAVERALAASPAAAHGLTVMPFLRGERSPGWATHATASFVGIRATTTPEDLVRASLEAIAYRFVLIWRLLREVAPAREIVVGGRAARSSPAWMQVLADALQVPLVGSVEGGTSARGVAVMALKALGAIDRYDSLPVTRYERYTPVEANGEAHRRAIAKHEALYGMLVARQQ
jgi:gluconokinase